MTANDRFRFENAWQTASTELPPGCHAEFGRLAKLIEARPGKFQLIILDCRSELLRDRVIEKLETMLHRAGRASARLRLNEGRYTDVASVEQEIALTSDRCDVIHLTGGPTWFNAARWDGFNIRREALARRAKAALLLWLDAEAVADLANRATDLWAWRAAVIALHETAQPIPAAAVVPDIRQIDSRTMPERAKRIAFLREILQDTTVPDDTRFSLAVELGDLCQSIGDLAQAEAAFRKIALPAAPSERERAITMGRIADILHDRGELDEALRIRREEELPVYERLGDVRERAVTMGRVADILQARGELDEALRIRREEELPVYERLGNVRFRAVTMGQVADILQARGELDEALRVRREEELPIYERLGDVRSRAITLGRVADILQSRGELDEALRIRREEELPVYERLGDVRLRAITMGKVADILQARGKLDEALRIRREEELPVYERLGDVRSRAIAMGKVADILQVRGELDEALRIRREEQLPVYERLGDVRLRSVTLQKMAVALIEHGGMQDSRAQEILQSLNEAFAIARQLRLPDGIARVGIMLAQALHATGQTKEALYVLNQAEPAFVFLHDETGLQLVKQVRERLAPDPIAAEARARP